MIRNPYDRDADHQNWHRWNIGEEDGSRGTNRRGISAAYNQGYEAGQVNLQTALAENPASIAVLV